jgi:hypothetical protein
VFHWCCFVYLDCDSMFHWCCFVYLDGDCRLHLYSSVFLKCDCVLQWCCWGIFELFHNWTRFNDKVMVISAL